MKRIVCTAAVSATVFATVLAAAASVRAAPSAPPAQIIAVCTEQGQIAVLDKADVKQVYATFQPSRSLSPLNVAVGDFNGDGNDDVVAAGDGSVRFLSSQGAPLWSITPFPGFNGSVSVAVGDVNGDGVPEIITGAGAGAPGGHVKVFNGLTGELHHSFLTQGTAFLGGVYVASGDVNGDGFADIIVGAGPGAGPHVKVFNGVSGELHASFFAYDAGFQGGVRVAAGDINGDGTVEIITGAGPGAPGGHVKAFDGRSLETKASFFAYEPAFTGGIFVAAADGEIAVTPGTGAGGFATIRTFRSGAQSQWLMPFASYKGGLTLAVSPVRMGKAPSRPEIPGQYDLKTTW